MRVGVHTFALHVIAKNFNPWKSRSVACDWPRPKGSVARIKDEFLWRCRCSDRDVSSRCGHTSSCTYRHPHQRVYPEPCSEFDDTALRRWCKVSPRRWNVVVHDRGCLFSKLCSGNLRNPVERCCRIAIETGVFKEAIADTARYFFDQGSVARVRIVRNCY